MRRGVIGRLVFGGGRRWPWAVVAFAGLLGMAGAVAPWEGPAWPWRSPGIYAVHRGTTSYPHDARQCFALAAIVVVVGVAGWFGVRGLVSRLVLLLCGVVVAFIPFANWVWLSDGAYHRPPKSVVRFMDRLPHSPSADSVRFIDAPSRGWGLLLTTAAGLLIVATAFIPATWPNSRQRTAA
jgi:hypothetical protein